MNFLTCKNLLILFMEPRLTLKETMGLTKMYMWVKLNFANCLGQLVVLFFISYGAFQNWILKLKIIWLHRKSQPCMHSFTCMCALVYQLFVLIGFLGHLALVDTLVAKTRAWEEDRGISFTYDGVPLLAMLDEYAMLRQEREEEKRRMRVSFID